MKRCFHCQDDLDPIEGNDTREFCSDDHEWAYYNYYGERSTPASLDDNTDHYNYGRN